jgi:hypothetical protein
MRSATDPMRCACSKNKCLRVSTPIMRLSFKLILNGLYAICVTNWSCVRERAPF